MLFLADAVIYGGQFNSSNFIADLNCSTEKLAESHKVFQETKIIHMTTSTRTKCVILQTRLKWDSCICMSSVT